jgi:hypothetical protein
MEASGQYFSGVFGRASFRRCRPIDQGKASAENWLLSIGH